MKRTYCLFFCCLICFRLCAQPLPDSIKNVFNAAKTGVDKGKILIRYFDANTDNNTFFQNLVALRQYFEEKKNPDIVDYVRLGMCRQLSRASEYADAINELFQLLPRFEQRKDKYGVMICNRHLSYAYYAAGDKEKTLYYDQRTVDLSIPIGLKYDVATAYNNLAADMAEYGHFDSALIYSYTAVKISKEINSPLLIGKTLGTLGEYYLAKKEYDSAIIYLEEALPIALMNSQLDLAYVYNDFSEIYQAKNEKDSAIYYAFKGAGIAKQRNLKGQLLRGYTFLSKIYKAAGPLDSAYKYLVLTTNTKDSIFSAEKTKQVQLINSREQNRQREADQQRLDLQNKIKIYALISGLIIFTLIGLILFRNSRKEKNAKILLQKKNELIEQALGDLKATQSQLIQSEKMASLGELTAGIAHEIQNPLNFVNNFSEVNKEMLEELKAERLKPKAERDEDLEIDLINDVIANEEKINHHGKRADAIVKGMLQHSRQTSGIKEPKDINALCDEYLRLSYHGLRAKDKSFNADFKTKFDESIGKINIIPQDIGRVLLNLYNNAFYALAEKKKTADETYQPTITVTTKHSVPSPLDRGWVEVTVTDNGNGILQNIIDKIFQPFFTTKPTGQGTGLGLSLSYDIIKSHGGELKVETKEGEGSEFIIQLPIV